MITKFRYWLSSVLFTGAILIRPKIDIDLIQLATEKEVITVTDHCQFLGTLTQQNESVHINPKYTGHHKSIIYANDDVSFNIRGTLTLAKGEKLMIMP